MNIYYYDEYYYWCMMASMQFAAAFAYIIAEYTYLLDVSTTVGLFRMKYSNLVAFVSLLYTRGFYYLWLCKNLLERYTRDNATVFFWCSLSIFILFGFFNIFIVIIPFYTRTVKWFKRARAFEAKNK